MTAFGLRRKILSSFVIIFLIWAVGLFWFYSQIPTRESSIAENAADAIIVLTGDKGRLEYGCELLAARKASVLFISGAGEKVSVADVLRTIPENTRKQIKNTQIKLGHEAENTIGNAQEIKIWLDQEKFSNIILVTSSYHIPRSMLEIKNVTPNTTIIPAPFIDNDNELIFSEYHKYIASKLRHIFVSATENK